MPQDKGSKFDVKRANYFQGMMLVDEDFKVEQTYHRQMRQNHNLELHTWGVVRGLIVSLNSGVISVTKGLAIDASGRELWWEGGDSRAAGAITEGNSLVMEWKQVEDESYPQMPDKHLRLIDTAIFSWKQAADGDLVLAQIVNDSPDNSVRRNAASVRANGNDLELRPVTRDGALRLKTGGNHQDFSAGATDADYGTVYAGFNVARIRVGGAPKWSFGSDGFNSGGALIFGDIFGKLRFVTAGSPGSAQTLDDQGILDRTRMTINQYGSVGIGTTDPKVPLHIKFPGGARGNAAVLNLEGTDHVYMQWYPSGFSDGRKGWIGYGSANEKNLTIQNEYAGGHLSLFAASGRVGIGVPDPQSGLDVKGGLLVRGGLMFADEQGPPYLNGWIGKWDDGGVKWLHIGGITDQGTRRLLLAAEKTNIGGNVGIGMEPTEARLSIQTSTGTLASNLMDFAVGQYKLKLRTESRESDTVSYHFDIVNNLGRSDNFLVFAKGNVGIGAYPTARLQVGSGVGGGKMSIYSDSGRAGQLQIGNPNSGNNDEATIGFITGATALGTEAPSGTNQWYMGIATWGLGNETFSLGRTIGSLSGAILTLRKSGNVGIGETNPEAALEVKGDIRTNVNDLYFTDKNNGIGFYGSTKKFATEDINGPVVYGLNGGALGSRQSPSSGVTQTIALRWTENGNVSIGKKLQIVNNVAGFSLEPADASPNAGYIRFGDNTGWKLHFGRAKTGGTELTGLNGIIMTLQDKGRVGIGTTDPDGQLEIRNPVSQVKVKFGGTGGDVHHLTSSRDLVFNSSTGDFLFRKLTTSYDTLSDFDNLMSLSKDGNLWVKNNISSPKWKVTNVINQTGPLNIKNTFDTGGGTLIIFASGSAFRQSGAGTIGMSIFLLVGGQWVEKGVLKAYTNEKDSHKSLVPVPIVVTGLSAGRQTIELRPINDQVFMDYNDYFCVTILELPF